MSLRLLIFFVCLFSVSTLPVFAHEYWLQPDKFLTEANQTIKTSIKVGQNFKGDNYAYIPKQIKSAKVYINEEHYKIRQRVGDQTITLIPEKEGLHILALTTNHFMVSYDTYDDFKKFVNKQDLAWVLEAHKMRQLPLKNFTEAYRRFAKTLIQVGKGEQIDQRLGLEFEWVLKNDLGKSDSDSLVAEPLVAELWWQGEPLKSFQLSLFINKDNQINNYVLKTNEQGQVRIKKVAGAKYLISAVQMVIPDKKVKEQTEAIWESLWTSISFGVR